MAKRQAVQLQTEIQTDEDFDKFLGLNGLLVIDVYTEWCGQCIALVNSLKKVKLEQGGDILNLAVARSDTISYLQRFQKKSEPTWLFITRGNLVNIMFGTDCPKLIDLITHEMKSLGKPRPIYNITEMLPIEIERDNAKNAVKRAKLQKELDEQERNRADYFHYVTDTIHENLPDVGITIFGPHIQRDTFRHLIDYGLEKFGIVCKDRRTQIITKEQFDIINYACKNPLSPDVLEAIDGKELFIGFWRVSDELKEPVPEILQKYADDVTRSHRLPPDEYHTEEQIIPPLVTPEKVKIEFELPADQECPIDEEPEASKETTKQHKNADAARESTARENAQGQEDANEDEEGDENEEYEEGEGTAAAEEPTTMDAPPMPEFDIGGFDDDADHASEGEEEEEIIDDTPKKNICTKTVTMPAVWVPKDWRTHAAVIYEIFRGQTTGFLPPDPVPEPPHVIMAFDTYKKRDLINFAERNKEDIPLYGFFTSDEVEEAQFITNNKNTYDHHTQAATDKLIFKVNKRTSNTMLSLATYGPTYVSPNTAVGAEEAKLFFPEDYVSAEEEMLKSKKDATTKGKGHKGTKDSVKQEISYERLQAEAEAAGKEAEEQAAAKEDQAAPAAKEADVEAGEIAEEAAEQPPPVEELQQPQPEAETPVAPAPQEEIEAAPAPEPAIEAPAAETTAAQTPAEEPA